MQILPVQSDPAYVCTEPDLMLPHKFTIKSQQTPLNHAGCPEETEVNSIDYKSTQNMLFKPDFAGQTLDNEHLTLAVTQRTVVPQKDLKPQKSVNLRKKQAFLMAVSPSAKQVSMTAASSTSRFVFGTQQIKKLTADKSVNNLNRTGTRHL